MTIFILLLLVSLIILFSEILLISDDKIIFQEEEYLDYVLGYSAFKSDREALEVMREENLKDLESFRNGLL